MGTVCCITKEREVANAARLFNIFNMYPLWGTMWDTLFASCRTRRTNSYGNDLYVCKCTRKPPSSPTQLLRDFQGI